MVSGKGNWPKGYFHKPEVRAASKLKSKEHRDWLSVEKTKHGVYRYLIQNYHSCKTCVLFGAECEVGTEELKESNAACPVLDSYQAYVVDEVRALPHVTEADELLISQLIRNLGAILVGNLYLRKFGMYLEEDKKVISQPVIQTLQKYESLLQKNLDALAISPVKRRTLGLDKPGGPTFVQMIRASMQDENEAE